MNREQLNNIYIDLFKLVVISDPTATYDKMIERFKRVIDAFIGVDSTPKHQQETA